MVKRIEIDLRYFLFWVARKYAVNKNEKKNHLRVRLSTYFQKKTEFRPLSTTFMERLEHKFWTGRLWALVLTKRRRICCFSHWFFLDYVYAFYTLKKEDSLVRSFISEFSSWAGSYLSFGMVSSFKQGCLYSRYM